jgi:hypothetical protein
MTYARATDPELSDSPDPGTTWGPRHARNRTTRMWLNAVPDTLNTLEYPLSCKSA